LIAQRLCPAIGVHAFAAGGLASGALRCAADVGAQAMQVFAELLHHPVAAQVPFIVETPGPQAAQAADVATLKGLRGSARVSAVSCAPPAGHNSPR
jgi:hypothetical protein